MANLVYPLALELYSFPSILTDDIRVMLTRGYTPTPSTDQFMSDVLLADRIASTAALGTKSFTGGLFKAANTTFGVVGAGAACEGLVLYHYTGTPASEELLCFIDTGYTGLPVTPDGLNSITITWPSGGIFAI